MPGMNGMELIQRCKAVSPGLKTISYSGALTNEDIANYPEQPDLMLSKPSNMRELVAVVNQLLSGGGQGGQF